MFKGPTGSMAFSEAIFDAFLWKVTSFESLRPKSVGLLLPARSSNRWLVLSSSSDLKVIFFRSVCLFLSYVSILMEVALLSSNLMLSPLLKAASDAGMLRLPFLHEELES